MKQKLALIFIAAAAAGTVPPVVRSQDPTPQAAPRLMHYQGRFADDNGAPLLGPIKLRFTIFSAPEGGPGLWTEVHSEVPLEDGTASVLMGSQVSLPVGIFANAELYLAISVNDGGELSPRFRLAAVPYAFEAVRLGGMSPEDFEPKGAVLALLVNDNTPPNEGSNRVHWNNLTGVPEGLADGVDDGVILHGTLEGLDADDHPQYALRSDLNATSGSGPNEGKKLVHWDNLLGVPSGFADGADNTGAGGTTVHSELTGLDADDHPQYALDTDLTDHTAAPDPHPLYALDADLAAHAADSTLHGGGDGAPPTTDASKLTTGILDPDRLGAESITAEKLALNSVTSGTILDSTITGADLAPGLLTSVILGPGSVEETHLADSAVTSAKLAEGSVASVHVADGALTGSDVQDESLTGADLLDGTVTSADIANNTILSDDIQNETITGADIQDSGITGAEIQNGSLTGADLQAGTITSQEIQDNGITGVDIQDNTLGSIDLQDETGVADTSAAPGQVVGGTAATVLTKSISCPGPGWVLAIATAEACIDSPLVAEDHQIFFSVSSTPATFDESTRVKLRAQPPANTVLCAPVTSQGVFPVASGTAQFYVVSAGTGSGPMELSRIRLSLVFMPTQY